MGLHNPTYVTRSDAERDVYESIHPGMRDDFDLDAIVDEIYLAKEKPTESDYWEIVEKHAK